MVKSEEKENVQQTNIDVYVIDSKPLMTTKASKARKLLKQERARVVNKTPSFTQATLLERGWSKRAIEELLPPPTLVNNPKYKCASPMKLWEQKIVLKKEKTKKFKEFSEKKAKRRQVANKVVEKKTTETIEMIEGFSLEVRRIDMDLLRQKTISSKEEWYENTGQYDKCNIHSVDKDTLKRWLINYIRHNLSNYDLELQELYRKTGGKIAYNIYKEKLMMEIKKVYPELK